jgi:hypothetical protein
MTVPQGVIITAEQQFWVLIFKLEEEVKPALLLLLPKRFAETADFGSASDLGCRLVVSFAQARADKTAIFQSNPMVQTHKTCRQIGYLSIYRAQKQGNEEKTVC